MQDQREMTIIPKATHLSPCVFAQNESIT
jgi:hypothetical protein